jgi:hypothetical protein
MGITSKCQPEDSLKKVMGFCAVKLVLTYCPLSSIHQNIEVHREGVHLNFVTCVCSDYIMVVTLYKCSAGSMTEIEVAPNLVFFACNFYKLLFSYSSCHVAWV